MQFGLCALQVAGNLDSALFRRQLLLSDDTAIHVELAQSSLHSADRVALQIKADRPATDTQLSQINLQVKFVECTRPGRGMTFHLHVVVKLAFHRCAGCSG